MGAFKDLTGMRFGRLTVVGVFQRAKRLGGGKSQRTKWICVCDCGQTLDGPVETTNLSSGHTTSCGCYAEEVGKVMNKTHGMCRTPIYWTWQAMITRCTDPKVHNYHRYGGRGITVDPLWLVFENFYSDMGERPTPGHSLDRVNNDLGYSKDNCVWSTKTEQANNRHTNKLVSFRGLIKSVAQWAVTLGVSRDLIYQRLFIYGWEVEDAFTLPVGARRQITPK